MNAAGPEGRPPERPTVEIPLDLQEEEVARYEGVEAVAEKLRHDKIDRSAQPEIDGITDEVERDFSDRELDADDRAALEAVKGRLKWSVGEKREKLLKKLAEIEERERRMRMSASGELGAGAVAGAAVGAGATGAARERHDLDAEFAKAGMPVPPEETVIVEKEESPDLKKLSGTSAEMLAQLQQLYDQLVNRPIERGDKKLYRKLVKKGGYEKMGEADTTRLKTIEEFTEAEYIQMQRGEVPWKLNAVWRALREARRGELRSPDAVPSSPVDKKGIGVGTIAAAGAGAAAVGLGMAAGAERETDETITIPGEHGEPPIELGVEEMQKLGEIFRRLEAFGKTFPFEYVKDAHKLIELKTQFETLHIEDALNHALEDINDPTPIGTAELLKKAHRDNDFRKRYLKLWQTAIDAAKAEEERVATAQKPVDEVTATPKPPEEKRPDTAQPAEPKTEQRAEKIDTALVQNRVITALNAEHETLVKQIVTRAKEMDALKDLRAKIAGQKERFREMAPLQFLKAIAEDFDSTNLTRDEAKALIKDKMGKKIQAVYLKNTDALITQIDALLKPVILEEPKIRIIGTEKTVQVKKSGSADAPPLETIGEIDADDPKLAAAMDIAAKEHETKEKKRLIDSLESGARLKNIDATKLAIDYETDVNTVRVLLGTREGGGFTPDEIAILNDTDLEAIRDLLVDTKQERLKQATAEQTKKDNKLLTDVNRELETNLPKDLPHDTVKLIATAFAEYKEKKQNTNKKDLKNLKKKFKVDIRALVPTT